MRTFIACAVGSLVLIFFIFRCGGRNYMDKMDHLYDYGECTIGQIDFIVFGEYMRREYLDYSYTVNDKPYKNLLGGINLRFYPKTARDTFREVKEGARFLVLYDPDDPENSIMLLHYPITQPGDLDVYKQRLKDANSARR